MSKIRKFILDGTHGCGKTTITRKYIGLERFGIFSLDEAVRTLGAFPQYSFQPTDLRKYSFSEAVLIGHKSAQAKAIELCYDTNMIVEDRSIVGPLIYSSYFNANAKLRDYNWERPSPIRDISLKEYAYAKISEVRKIGWFDDAKVYILKPLKIDFNNTDDKFRIMAHTEENLTEKEREEKQKAGERIQYEVFELAQQIYNNLGIPFVVCDADTCSKEVELAAKEVILHQIKDHESPNYESSEDYYHSLERIWDCHLESTKFKYSPEKFIEACRAKSINENSIEGAELRGYFKKCHEVERGIF